MYHGGWIELEKGQMCHCASGPLFLLRCGILLRPQGNSPSVKSGFRYLMPLWLKVDFVVGKSTEVFREGAVKIRMCHCNLT